MPCEKGSSMVRRFSMRPLHWQMLSSMAPILTLCPLWSVTPTNFLLCSHHRHPCQGGEGAGGCGAARVITWGLNTGCVQQRKSSLDPLHSNTQSVVEQSRNSNSGAKQSTGTEGSMLVLLTFTQPWGGGSRGKGGAWG